MEKQLILYSSAVPVSSQLHKDFSVQPTKSYAFAAQATSVPLVSAEFGSAAADFAIVFAGSAQKVAPMAVLGLKENQNLFVDKRGNWQGRYIPAFIRRYPFVFSQVAGAENLILSLDETYSGLNKKGKGERLFDDAGQKTQYLNGVLEFASNYQAQFVKTAAFCDQLIALDLLESGTATITTPKGQTHSLNGFFTVNREKLNGLSDTDLRAAGASGVLELCYTHLQSLNNLAHLGDRI